jgi:hypothetical protein
MRAMFFITLLACQGDPSETATDPGLLALCLDGPGVSQDMSPATWAFSGVVDALGGALPRGEPALDGCSWMEGGRSLTLTDDDGATWTLGWAASAGTGDTLQPMTPELDVAPGDRLEVEARAWFDWAFELDVMVRDADGVVFAGAEGYYTEVWSEVTSGAGLTVTDAGATRSLGDDGCGARSAHALRFDGDDALELDVWVEGTLTLEGQALQARNVGAWAFDGEIGCTDVWGPMPWMVFRE